MTRVPVCSSPPYESCLDRISLEGVSRGLGPQVYRRFQLGNGTEGKPDLNHLLVSLLADHPFVRLTL